MQLRGIYRPFLENLFRLTSNRIVSLSTTNPSDKLHAQSSELGCNEQNRLWVSSRAGSPNLGADFVK